MRQKERLAYDSWQFVAPFPDDRPPQAAEFVKVKCHDISVGGLSFYMDAVPKVPRFVFLLGEAPFVAMIAEMSRHDTLPDGSVLVGCRFLERLDTRGRRPE